MPPAPRPAGFTLLEALVAAFVVSIVMTFSLPSLVDGLRAHSMTSGTRITANYLRVVRSTAIARGTRARLVVVDRRRLATDALVSGAWTRVGRGVALDGVAVAEISPAGGIAFEREGTLNAPGFVRLENGRGDQRKVTVSILGAIELAP